jgi:hypothetical protein
MLLSWLATALILNACGTERWRVKTTTDPGAALVQLAAQASTISQLSGLRAPPYSDTRGRTVPEEQTVYEVTAYVLEFKLEKDSDFHVVIADSPTADRSGRHTMIVEFPAPQCARGSPQLEAITKARKDFVQLVGQAAPGRLQRLKNPVPVTIRGVGFFDRYHAQTGHAKNLIELHPVLSIEPATVSKR